MKNSKPTSSAAQHLSSNSIPAAAFLPIKQLISLAYLAVEFPPSPQPWDDFLDFSRMKLPQDFWTVSCRLERNLNYRFKGNYFILWLLGIIIAGTLFMDYLFFLSLSFLIVAWFIICITSVNPIHWKQLTGRGGGRESIVLIKKKKKCHEQQEQKYIGMENERHIVLFTVSHIGFFFLGALGKMYLVTSIVTSIVFFHAILRPVAVELMRKKPMKIIASDGFVDDQEEEVEQEQNDDDDDGQEEILLFSKEQGGAALTTTTRAPIESSSLMRRLSSTNHHHQHGNNATNSSCRSNESNKKNNVIGVMMVSNHLDDEDTNFDATSSTTTSDSASSSCRRSDLDSTTMRQFYPSTNHDISYDFLNNASSSHYRRRRKQQ